MPMKLKNNYRIGRVVLEEINFDHIFKRVVMRSGTVGKIYLPRELIGKKVYVIVDLNGLNGIENDGKESGQTPKPSSSIPEDGTN